MLTQSLKAQNRKTLATLTLTTYFLSAFILNPKNSALTENQPIILNHEEYKNLELAYTDDPSAWLEKDKKTNKQKSKNKALAYATTPQQKELVDKLFSYTEENIWTDKSIFRDEFIKAIDMKHYIEEEGVITGLPRPFTENLNTEAFKNKPPKRMPIQWSNSKNDYEQGIYSRFNSESTYKIHQTKYNTCSICGDKLGKNKIYGIIEHTYNNIPISSGTAIHPKCALLAYNYCPHFKNGNNQFRLWNQKGTGIHWEETAYYEQKQEEKYSKISILDALLSYANHGIYPTEFIEQYLNQKIQIIDFPPLLSLALKTETTPITIQEIKELIKQEKEQTTCPYHKTH